MWVVTFHSQFLYLDTPLPSHPPSYWLRQFSNQTFSRINIPTFSNLAILILLNPGQQTQVNQPRRGSRNHQGSLGQQGSGPKRYPEVFRTGSWSIFPSERFPSWPRFSVLVLLIHHLPSMWKHARVMSILKLGKDPAVLSSYRPISFLDTIGKLFEKILLARLLHVVSERGLMRDEQFGFRPGLARPCI